MIPSVLAMSLAVEFPIRKTVPSLLQGAAQVLTPAVKYDSVS